MLLLNPERRRQSLGSAGIHFQWRLWGQQTFLETSLVWTEQTFHCGRNALECKTLYELVTHTQQWDWAVVSCQTRIFTRFLSGYHLGLSSDLRDGMGSHDSEEEFGQPGASFGTQVLQEFHVDVVVTWGCRWFRLLQSSWNLLFSGWMGRLLSDICCRRVLPCIRTWRSNFLSCGALATWMRWAATALALTDGWVDLGGCWAAPSRRISAQLFQLKCVKFICDVSSSQRFRRAGSSDSMRWSAMSGSPDSSYCFSKSWHSSSKHGVYVGRKSRGMEWRAAFCIAPQKRWHLTQSRLQVTGCTAERYCVLQVVVQGQWSFGHRSTFPYDVRLRSHGASKLLNFWILAYFPHTKPSKRTFR